MLGLLSQVNYSLAERVAVGLGMKVPAQPEKPMNHGVGADDFGKMEPKEVSEDIQVSDALSMIKNPTVTPTIASRKIAFLCNDGVSEASVTGIKKALLEQDAKACIIAPHLGFVATEEGGAIPIDFSFFTASSVLFDAIFIPAGNTQIELGDLPDAMEFLNDAYRHCKIIGTEGDGIDLLSAPQFLAKGEALIDGGIITSNAIGDPEFASNFIAAVATHRHWKREEVLNTDK
ncbi:Catalase HPII [compost metagenome]